MIHAESQLVPAAWARAGSAGQRSRRLYQTVASLLRVAWNYCLSPRPDETFSFTLHARGRERTISVDAFRPRGKEAPKQAPAVVLLHGVDGAYRFAYSHYAVAGALAKQGYAVYFVHYFDSVDYDDIWLFDKSGELDVVAVEKFCERDNSCWIAAVTGAMREIAARPEADASQIALFGYSLGCFVSLSAAEESLRQEGLPKVAAVVGHWGAKFPDVTFSEGFPPTRLFHGTQDPVVLLAWARETLDALLAIGVDAALMEIPRQGHRATSRKAWRETLAFLRQRIAEAAPATPSFASGMDSFIVG